MITAQTTESLQLNAKTPVALIQASNSSTVLPLREYLEAHGCSVHEGSLKSTRPDYHIAVGDLEFVKSIFAIPEEDGVKRLAIVLGCETNSLPESITAIHAKIVAIEGETITSRYVPSLFAFFFTSEEHILAIPHTDHRGGRISGTEPIREDPSQNEPTSELRDKLRISQLIKNIYERPSKKRWSSLTEHGRHFWIFGALLIVLAPLVIHTVTLFLSVASLGLTAAAIKSDNAEMGYMSIGAADVFLEISTRTLQTTKTLVYPFPPAHKLLRSQERILSLLTSGKRAAESFLRLREEGKTLSRLMLTESENHETSIVTVEAIRKELSYLQRILGVFIADSVSYRETASGWNTQLFSIALARVEAVMPKALRVVTVADRILSLYPELGGFSEEKHYVVLLQNNSELRPTGGFIGGIAQANIHEGKLTEFSVLDVYDLDGQLRGHVEPPQQIKEILGEIHWYLRDSNWNPDFRQSGNRALWFYEKESGVNTDGVIAINTRLLQDVLRVLGPIDLPDYQDRITAENFFEKSFTYIHTDFFPGSTQKKDFLGSLVNAILVKITDNPNNNILALLDVIVEGISQHDILMYMKNPKIQQTIDQYNWSNRVPGYVPCSQAYQSSCDGEYVFTVDANLGLSKVNQAVEKHVGHEILFSESGSKEESLDLVYKNNSAGNALGGGMYRNYMRVFLSDSKHIKQILLSGIPLSAKNEATSGATQIPYREPVEAPEGLLGTGIVFDIPAGESRSVKLTYTDSESIPEGSTISELYYQRQPGVDQSISTTILYPQQWKVVPFTVSGGGFGIRDFVAKPGRLEYNNTQRTDGFVQIKITR